MNKEYFHFLTNYLLRKKERGRRHERARPKGEGVVSVSAFIPKLLRSERKDKKEKKPRLSSSD